MWGGKHPAVPSSTAGGGGNGGDPFLPGALCRIPSFRPEEAFPEPPRDSVLEIRAVLCFSPSPARNRAFSDLLATTDSKISSFQNSVAAVFSRSPL